jgi:hypothetical protein
MAQETDAGQENRDLEVTAQETEVSRDWILKAARLPGKSLHLAIALQFNVLDERKRRVELGNVAWQRFGVDRNSKYRSLAWLESAGLIAVERKIGRAPLVTILDG